MMEFLPMALEAGTGLETVGTVVTQIFTWVTQCATTIKSEPIMLLGVGFFCIGGAIGLVRRFIGH